MDFKIENLNFKLSVESSMYNKSVCLLVCEDFVMMS